MADEIRKYLAWHEDSSIDDFIIENYPYQFKDMMLLDESDLSEVNEAYHHMISTGDYSEHSRNRYMLEHDLTLESALKAIAWQECCELSIDNSLDMVEGEVQTLEQLEDFKESVRVFVIDYEEEQEERRSIC